MNDMTRRDVVGFLAAGLAVGASAVRAGDSTDVADDSKPGATPAKSDDPMYDLAIQYPGAFMIVEEQTFPFEAPSYDLYITSARNGGKRGVSVREGSMRIFRADADQDDFTRQGGVYWKSYKTEGKFQFKKPGALVMVVREHHSMRCYALQIDLRC